MKENIYLTVIVPVYNEADKISQTIDLIEKYFRQSKIVGEIIIVNDGSSDKTDVIVNEKILKLKNLKIISYQPNKGKGAAVKIGMLKGQGEILSFTDADLSTPIEEMDKLLKKIENGYDIAIGSRKVKGAKIQMHQSFFREQFGKFYGLLTKIFVLRGIQDTQCGFKAFKKNVAWQLFKNPITPSAIWDIEILLLATIKNFSISEVPVVWRHNPNTKMPYNFSKSLKIFSELLKIKKRHQIGWPLKAKILE